MCCCCSGAMPMPSSFTVKRTFGPAFATRTSTRPPSGEYLIAFSVRLTRIWRSLSWSARTSGTPGSTTSSSSRPRRQPMPRGVDDRARDLAAVERLDLEDLAVRVEAARRQRAVEQPREPAGLVRDDVEQRVAHLVVDLALLQRERGAVDRRQRRAQLVRDDGDELVLEPVELAQLLERAMQPALVQRDGDQRADDDDRDPRRAVPQDDERDDQRRHHEERQRRRVEVAQQQTRASSASACARSPRRGRACRRRRTRPRRGTTPR